MTADLDTFTLSCLLMCAVGANAQGREADAMRYLEQIPADQLRRAEDLLAEMRNRVYLRRQSGVDFDADGRAHYQFTVRHQDMCGIHPVSGMGVCVCTPELTAIAALAPDDPRLPKEES